MLSVKDCYILIVDDEEDNHSLIEKALKSLDIQFLHAYNADEGLALFKQNTQIVAIIVDIQMPGKNGFEFAENYYKVTANKDIPILFMSAYRTDEADMFKGYKMGGFDYIARPFYPRILLEKMHVYIDLHLSKNALYTQNKQLQNTVDELRKTRERLLREYSLAVVSKSALIDSKQVTETLYEKLIEENRRLREQISDYMEKLADLENRLTSSRAD